MRCLSSSEGAVIGGDKGVKKLPNVTMATMDLSMTKSIAFVKEAADTAFASSASSMRKIRSVGASIPMTSFRTFRPNTHLITSLQDRILELERHIRSGKEESRQLRALLNEHRNERRRNQSDDVRRSAEVERILSDQMLNLRERIEVLSKSKGEMEQLLKQEKDHVKSK